ncbi:LptF/LptG family permease [Mesorhizobium xinjiangense]|uniref:LptF/LptG family permease n=1 Tax=Mesorhizobium xinjiangense TaxID=2678685 RepID=UPI0012ED9D6C|nr:LptF/LptG family permease [Mesorhizobium xinjiangense]
MRLIERYIFLRALKISLATLAAALGMAWTTQVLARLNLVTDSGQTAATFLELATLLLPTVIPVVIPFAVLIGITQTLTTMNQDSELAVIAAAGSPRRTVILPVMILGIAASITSFAVDNTLDPMARMRMREIVATAHADLLSTIIQEGTFRKIDDGLFVQVAQRLPDGRLGGIFVADSRQNNINLVYYAKNGIVHRDGARNVLMMTDGEVHRKVPGGDVSVVHFNSYAFDLSEFAPNSSEITLYPKDRELSYILDPDPNDPMYKNTPLMFSAELHTRFTEWTYPIIFALIALAVAGNPRSQRQAQIHPMVTAVAVAIVVRWEGYFTVNMIHSAAEYAIAAYAVPVLNTAFACYFIATNRTMEPPASWIDRMAGMAAGFRARLDTLRFRRRIPQEGGQA